MNVPLVHGGGRRLRVAAIAAATATMITAIAGCGTGVTTPAPPPAGASVAAPTGSAAGASSSAAGDARPDLIRGPVLPRSEPVSLQIPALDVNSDGIVSLGLQRDGTMQVPEDGGRAGWYTQAPVPGSLGPAVLAAHVDWKGKAGVFYNLRDLTPGAEVLVGRADGSTAQFRVTRVEQYPKQQFPTDEVFGTIDHAGLRLITCGGEFDQARSSYRDNIVVFAELVGAR